MTGHFNIFEFLLKTPTDLLRSYCARRGILGDFSWESGRYQNADKVGAALRATGEIRFKETVAELGTVWALAGPEFTRAILNEANFYEDGEATAAIERHKSHLLKALWVVAERHKYLANSKILRDVDKLAPRSWLKRRGVPLRPGPVDHSVVEQLEDELSKFFMRTDLRGQNCKIDRLLRGEEELFFAYSEDHPASDLVFDKDGRLTSQITSRVFLLIFKHNDTEQTLDLYFDGPNEKKLELQKVFVRTVIGEELTGEAAGDGPVYELKRTLEPGFEFRHSANLGISSVAITKMRFVVDGEPWRRFTAEADTVGHPDALSEFLRALKFKLPEARLRLDQICVNVSFHRRPEDRHAPSRTIYLTHPNLIRLKDDDLGHRIRKMILQSGIEQLNVKT